MNLINHPFQHILEISKTWEGSILEFSIYTYKPQSILDERSIISVEINDFNERWLQGVVNSLRSGEELAFHSKVKKRKRTYHVPLIDFACPASDLVLAKDNLSKLLPNRITSGLRYYDSGRSMHAYGSCLLSNKEWITTMGALLLANLPNKKAIVDSRWIGHRLMGGFTALRWTSNSSSYIKEPIQITE